MLAGAGPYDGWSSDDCDFPVRFAGAAQLIADSANDGGLWFVGINSGVNKLKKVGMRCRTLDWHNANPLMSNNNFVTLLHIEELNRSRSAFFSIKRDRTVDHCGPHFDFLAIEAYERLLIRCHVEIARKHSVSRGAGDLRICALHYFGALLTETQDQLVQRLACFGRHFDSGETLVRSLSADIDLSNLEVPAARQNLIQHLRQNQRVDNMP